MVNTTGKNGYGKKNYPPDDVLKEYLLSYALKRLTQTEKRNLLQKDLQLSIGLTKLNELEHRLDIPSVKRQKKTKEELAQAVIDEVSKDISQRNGPNYVKDVLRIKGIYVASRDYVREIMRENFPDSADKRFPGYKRQPVRRQALTALGPFHEIAGDGHEKIGALALQMEGLGLPIYGYRDKWSGKLLKLDVVPDCRSNGAIGHLFLDLVLALGGISLQLNLDKGSEIGWQVAFQTVLREQFAANIALDEYPAVALLRSIHNIIIESLWRWLREKSGHNLRLIILYGKENGLIQPSVSYHRDLFYWIFVPLVQSELDDFRTYWNLRHVRSQPQKSLPSNHVPDVAAEHPEMYGGIDCLVRIPSESVDSLRELLNEEVGPKEKFQTFYTPEFGSYATEVHDSIGAPTITLSNVWVVFTQMAGVMETDKVY
ncbi:hypothetical protein CPB83DRAFT_822529, partial [Crepidotus variabilis]